MKINFSLLFSKYIRGVGALFDSIPAACEDNNRSGKTNSLPFLDFSIITSSSKPCRSEGSCCNCDLELNIKNLIN